MEGVGAREDALDHHHEREGPLCRDRGQGGHADRHRDGGVEGQEQQQDRQAGSRRSRSTALPHVAQQKRDAVDGEQQRR